MIKYEFLKQDNKIIGFRTSGHAEFANHGQDPICAAVSVLTINTMNFIDDFTDDKVEWDANEEAGSINFSLIDVSKMSKESEVVLKALHYGIVNIKEEYGNEYISVTVKEV